MIASFSLTIPLYRIPAATTQAIQSKNKWNKRIKKSSARYKEKKRLQRETQEEENRKTRETLDNEKSNTRGTQVKYKRRAY